MCDTSKEKKGGRSGGPPGNDWIIFPKVLVTQDSLLSFIWLSAAFKVAKWVMPKVVQAAEWFREGRTDGSVSIVWKKANYLSLFLGFQTVRVGTVGTPVGTITLSCAYRINLAFMSTRWGKSLGIQQNSSKKKKELFQRYSSCFSSNPSSSSPQLGLEFSVAIAELREPSFQSGEAECHRANIEVMVYFQGCRSWGSVVPSNR